MWLKWRPPRLRGERGGGGGEGGRKKRMKGEGGGRSQGREGSGGGGEAMGAVKEPGPERGGCWGCYGAGGAHFLLPHCTSPVGGGFLEKHLEDAKGENGCHPMRGLSPGR